MNRTVLSKLPLVEFYQQFIPAKLCQQLIDLASSEQEEAKLISSLGKIVVDQSYISQKISRHKSLELDALFDQVFDLVEKTFHLDRSRFEAPVIRHYLKGDEFKLHHDYFAWKDGSDVDVEVAQTTKKGGNRTKTLIFYLNDNFEGGETYFPWLDILVVPEQGACLMFNYAYEDAMLNVKTDHAGLKVEAGEKWILTLMLREQETTVEVDKFKTYTRELEVYEDAQDVTFELECGPEWDRRIMAVSLPANNNPMNTVAVGWTGGMESSLLLYIVASLNTLQKVPYYIWPMSINFKHLHPAAEMLPFEDEDNMRFMLDLIKSKISDNRIERMFTWKVKTLDEGKPLGVLTGLQQVLNFEDYLHLYENKLYRQVLRQKIPKYAFTGENAAPTDISEPRWKVRSVSRPFLNDSRIIRPFLNLQKYHIIDAILQLGLEDIIQHTAKCKNNHANLNESCQLWQCEERRWGFKKLDLESMGYKYLCNLYGESSESEKHPSSKSTE